MIHNARILIVFVGIVFLFTTTLAALVEARRGGGGGRGGGFSRSSPAKSGSFSAKRSVPSTRQAGMQQRSAQTRDFQKNSAQRQGQRQVDQGNLQDNRNDRLNDRQDNRTENREDWQDHMDDAREDRQDYHDDRWDDWDDHWHRDYDNGAAFVAGAVVGGATVAAASAAASTTNYLTTLPCAATVVTVNGVTYYQCGTTWYGRGYQSDTIVYLIIDPPPGY